jgi:hypothetical protein
MADGMSFDKYIDNPSGGSVISARKMYKEMYRQKFDKILLREQGKIDFKVFKSGDKTDSYYIYMKIPSETIDKFYYDVVVRLYTTVGSKKSGSILRSYAVGFYSNDPSFVYTFAHSFKENGLFIDDLAPVMSKTALKKEAKTRNPQNQVWYVKSLYFAYLTMEKYGLFSRLTLDRLSTNYVKKDLLRMITPADEKIVARQQAGEKLEAEKRKQKAEELKAKEAKRNPGVSAKQSIKAALTKKTKTTGKTKTTSTVKKSKIVSMKKKT